MNLHFKVKVQKHTEMHLNQGILQTISCMALFEMQTLLFKYQEQNVTKM